MSTLLRLIFNHGDGKMSIVSIGKPAAAVIATPRISTKALRRALRVGCAIALTAATGWIVYEAVGYQTEQQMISDFQLGDRP